jgi:hypothetical protein
VPWRWHPPGSYSHSTWVELDNRSPLDLLTNPDRTRDELLAALDRWKVLQGPRDARAYQSCEATERAFSLPSASSSSSWIQLLAATGVRCRAGRWFDPVASERG